MTIIALGLMVHRANEVADKLAKDGISVEVVDPRTISPLDEEGILESVASTGRVLLSMNQLHVVALVMMWLH